MWLCSVAEVVKNRGMKMSYCGDSNQGPLTVKINAFFSIRLYVCSKIKFTTICSWVWIMLTLTLVNIKHSKTINNRYFLAAYLNFIILWWNVLSFKEKRNFSCQCFCFNFFTYTLSCVMLLKVSQTSILQYLLEYLSASFERISRSQTS